MMPPMELTGKSKSFTWSSSAAEAFDNLKRAFTSTLILVHATLEKPFIIVMNVSGFALGISFSQIGDEKKLHPIAFHSCKFKSVEINYEIHEKEPIMTHSNNGDIS